MRSGHRRAPALLAVRTAAAAAALLAGGLASAAERAVLVDPGDPTLVGRVRGQSADLPYALSLSTAPAPATASLAAAEELGRAENATVVIWFEKLPSGFMVYVADLGRGELLARRVTAGAHGDDLAESARAEAAALVVRSALLSVSEGGANGRGPSTPERDPARPAPVEPRLRDEAAAPGAHPDASVADRATRDGTTGTSSIEALIGYQLGADLGDAPVHQAPLAAFTYRARRWRAGLLFEYGLPRDLEDERTRITLSRHAATAMGGHAFVSGPRAELGAEVGAGVTVYSRRTEALASEVIATAPNRSALPTGFVGLALTWLPTDAPLGVALRGGADVLFGRLRLRYESSGASVERASTWPLSPYIGAGVVLRSGTF